MHFWKLILLRGVKSGTVSSSIPSPGLFLPDWWSPLPDAVRSLIRLRDAAATFPFAGSTSSDAGDLSQRHSDTQDTATNCHRPGVAFSSTPNRPHTTSWTSQSQAGTNSSMVQACTHPSRLTSTHLWHTHTLEAQPLCPAGNPACSPSHLTHPIGPLPAGFSSVAFASKFTHIHTLCIPSLGQTQKLLPAASTKHMGCDPWPCYSCWHGAFTHLTCPQSQAACFNTPTALAPGVWRPTPLVADSEISLASVDGTRGTYTFGLTPGTGTSFLSNTLRFLQYLALSCCSIHTLGIEQEYGDRLIRRYKKIGQTVVIRRRV